MVDSHVNYTIDIYGFNEEMPETCSWFDPYSTGDEGTINESQFRQQVMETYQKAVAIAARAKKVS